jgi:hypothetical protein
LTASHGVPPPPYLPAVDRTVRKIEFLLEPVKCIIADDAGASQLAKPRAAACQRPLAQCLHPKKNHLLGIYATSRARFEMLKKLPERDTSCPDLTCKRLSARIADGDCRRHDLRLTWCSAGDAVRSS